MSWVAIAIRGLVTLQRLAELVVARANTVRLISAGGSEVGASHYPAVVALHSAWLIALWWLAPSRPVSIPFVVLYLIIELGRFWVLRTLRARWTTRIIVVPGERLIAGGPYRFVSHPNYWVVAAEIAVLPLVFGLWRMAILFTILNAAMMWVRIRAENSALASLHSPG